MALSKNLPLSIASSLCCVICPKIPITFEISSALFKFCGLTDCLWLRYEKLGSEKTSLMKQKISKTSPLMCGSSKIKMGTIYSGTFASKKSISLSVELLYSKALKYCSTILRIDFEADF